MQGLFLHLKKILQIIFSGHFSVENSNGFKKCDGCDGGDTLNNFVEHKLHISEKWNVKGQPKHPS